MASTRSAPSSTATCASSRSTEAPMRAPLSWIDEFTPGARRVAVGDLVSALNQLGLEVEGVEQPGAEITGVVAACVLDVVRHPNADKLSFFFIAAGASET